MTAKRCAECEAPFTRKEGELLVVFANRVTCSEECRLARRRRQYREKAKAVRDRGAAAKSRSVANIIVEDFNVLKTLSRSEIIRRKLKELDEMRVSPGSYAEAVIIERQRLLKAELAGLTRKVAA